MLQIIKSSYRTQLHTQPPCTVAVSPSKDLINFTSFPSFVLILNFQIWLWLSCSARASGCRPSPSPHGSLLKCSRLLPAVRRCAFIQKRGAPNSPLNPLYRGLGSPPRGVSDVNLLLHEVIHDGALLTALRFQLRIYHCLLTAWIACSPHRTTLGLF